MLLIFVVAVLTLGAANGLAGGGRARRVGLVTALSGSATVTRPGGTVEPLAVTDELHQGDIVEAHANGIVRIQLGTEVSLTVRPFSRLRIREGEEWVGMRYTLHLLLRALGRSTARALMRHGEPFDRHSRNTPASIRG